MAGHYIVKINNKCNSNCCFCADSAEVRNQPDFDYSKLIYDLEENRKKFDSLIISGGEPTIYKNILKYINYAKDICKYKRITLTTNGFLLAYDSFTDKLIKNGIDSFIISFIASNKKTYDTVTKVKGSFKYATKALSNLKKRNQEVRINIVPHKLNYKDIEKTIEFLIKQKVDSIQISFMDPIGSSVVNNKSTLAVTYTKLMPYIKTAFKIANKLDFNKLYIENFPICIAKDFIDNISDLKKPDENKDYYNACKTKPEKCKKCSYFNVCDGIWKAYLEQFGDEEIKPPIGNLREYKKDSMDIMAKEYNFPKKFEGFYGFYAAYFSDIAGLEAGFKKASIFNIKNSDLKRHVSFLKKLGYSVGVSDFANNHTSSNKIKQIHERFKDDSIFMVYVSRDAQICKEIKELDKEMHFPTSSKKKNYFRLYMRAGELLGYPKCCVNFFYDIHNKPECCDYLKNIKSSLGYETLYKSIALKRSKHIYHLLNNFNSTIPQIYSFSACSYNCENAKKFVSKVIDYIKDGGINYQKIKNEMVLPLLFFSTGQCIVFSKAEKCDGKILYKLLKYSKIPKETYSMFKDGDSFTILDTSIDIFKKNKLVHKIVKENDAHWIFIEFNDVD